MKQLCLTLESETILTQDFKTPGPGYQATGSTDINGVRWNYTFEKVNTGGPRYDYYPQIHLRLWTIDGREVEYTREVYTYGKGRDTLCRIQTTTNGDRFSWTLKDFEEKVPILAIAIREICEMHYEKVVAENKIQQEKAEEKRQREMEQRVQDLTAPIDYSKAVDQMTEKAEGLQAEEERHQTPEEPKPEKRSSWRERLFGENS